MPQPLLALLSTPAKPKFPLQVQHNIFNFPTLMRKSNDYGIGQGTIYSGANCGVHRTIWAYDNGGGEVPEPV